MASLLTTDIKDIFTIKLKPRSDDHTDQFSRIFMVKVLVVSSLVMGVDWFQDSVTCMVLNTDFVKVGPEFIHSACWIQGYYVYPHLVGSEHSSHYYGIPKNIHHDGTKVEVYIDGTKKISTCSVKVDGVNSNTDSIYWKSDSSEGVSGVIEINPPIEKDLVLSRRKEASSMRWFL